MRSNHDDRSAAASEEGRGHGAEAVKCSRKIRGQHIGPIFFALSKEELAPSYSSIAYEHRRERYQAAGGFHHLLHCMRLANIGFVERSSSTGSYHLPERVLGRLLVSMVMYPDRPASRRKGQADRTTDPSGRTGHKHHMFGFASWFASSAHHRSGSSLLMGMRLWEGYRMKASLQARHGREPPSFPCRPQDSYGTVTASFNQRRISRMQLTKKPGHRMALIVGAALLLACATSPAPLAAEDTGIIAQSPDYFPDQIGNEWHYRGQITEGPLQTIEHKFFSNVSSVTGTKTIKGMTVTVFHDTNPGNHGPSDSFYRRDSVGIVYYGSEPGTPLEKQLVPYQIVRFPMRVSSSFPQFNRKGLDFGTDMDRDGENEKVDAQGDATVVGQESVTVPAGTFKDAVKVEARMYMRIHLSGANRTALGTDVMTAWFAKGVGLVKYVERQELSPLEDRGVVTDIMEELESYEIKPPKASLGRRESSTEGLLADDTGDHELRQVLFTSRLRSDSREPMASKGLATD